MPRQFKELGVTNNNEAYMRSVVIKKILESVSFEFKWEIGQESDEEVIVIAAGDRLAIVKALRP